MATQLQSSTEVHNEAACLHIFSSFQDKLRLEKHNSNQIGGFLHQPINGEQQLYCNYCHFSCYFEQALLFLEHLKQHIFSCQYCGFQSFSHSHTRLHVQNNHEESSNYDEISLLTTSEVVKETDFEENTSVNQQVIKTDLECSNKNSHSSNFIDNCSCPSDAERDETTMISKETQEKLKQKIKTRKQFSCKKCNTIFVSRQLLREHRIVCRIVPFPCDICGEVMRRKQIKNHRLTKHGVKPYKCSVCDKTFLRREYLERHKKQHENGLNYMCEICGKECKNKMGLFVHMKIHNIENQGLGVDRTERHVCDVCGTEFKNKLRLNYHMKVHDRGYFCSECGKKQKSEADLRRHIKAHVYKPTRKAQDETLEKILQKEVKNKGNGKNLKEAIIIE